MEAIKRILCNPGAGDVIQAAATTQIPNVLGIDGEKSNDQTIVVNAATETSEAKKRILDRWLDWLVQASGSKVAFFGIITMLLVWAFLCIRFKDAENWQVTISDVQAIFSYAFDSLLMRQQLIGHNDLLIATAKLRSRIVSHNRMLIQIKERIGSEEMDGLIMKSAETAAGFESELPKEDWFGRSITLVSQILGHIVAVAIYWALMILWLGFGSRDKWGPRWLLDVNSATSALMMLIFSFLAIIRERHTKYAKKCLDATFQLDEILEIKLRQLTGDQIVNETIIIPNPRVNVLQRAINYYADVVGTLVGVVLLIIVIIVWIAIGPFFSFSSSWWLIIGTYAGLIGLNDGFVLRNMQGKLRDNETVEYSKVEDDDYAMFSTINAQIPVKESISDISWTHIASAAMNRICAHEITVLLGLLIVLGLLTASSVMHWDTIGQLISNVPPSIIESFFMMILITAHNFYDARQRVCFSNTYERRLRLVSIVNTIGACTSKEMQKMA